MLANIRLRGCVGRFAPLSLNFANWWYMTLGRCPLSILSISLSPAQADVPIYDVPTGDVKATFSCACMKNCACTVPYQPEAL